MFSYTMVSYMWYFSVSTILWDMFIDPSLQPQHSFLHRGMLDSIMDETDLPTEQMFEAAFNFRRKKLFHLCYWYLETFKLPLINNISQYQGMGLISFTC